MASLFPIPSSHLILTLQDLVSVSAGEQKPSTGRQMEGDRPDLRTGRGGTTQRFDQLIVAGQLSSPPGFGSWRLMCISGEHTR